MTPPVRLSTTQPRNRHRDESDEVERAHIKLVQRLLGEDEVDPPGGHYDASDDPNDGRRHLLLRATESRAGGHGDKLGRSRASNLDIPRMCPRMSEIVLPYYTFALATAINGRLARLVSMLLGADLELGIRASPIIECGASGRPSGLGSR